MKEYTVDIPLEALVRAKCGTLENLSDLLNAVGIEHRPTQKDLRISCPECGTANRDTTLSVYLKNDEPLWKCHRCDLQRRKYNTLIGLYRVFNNANPWQAVNTMFDLAFENDSPSTTHFPLDVDGLKGKLLHEVPPHKLYWALVGSDSVVITQEIKDEIADRLFLGAA